MKILNISEHDVDKNFRKTIRCFASLVTPTFPLGNTKKEFEEFYLNFTLQIFENPP